MARLRRHGGSSDSDEDGDWIAYPGTSSSAPAAVRRCKVDGCGVSLAEEKTFFRRSRCCQVHARELLVHVDGQARRLCQQCSSFHPVSAFDGTKRSCRERLELHKIRQRELNSRRMAQAAAFQAAQEAAETEAGPTQPAATGVQVPTLTASMLPAVPPGPQLPTLQAATVLAAQQLQHQCIAQAQMQNPHLPAIPLQPTMPQIPPRHQQAPPQQQQGLGGIGSAAAAADVPGIFADVPLNELPFDMQPQCQVEKMVNWEVQQLSTFWDAPPQASCGTGDRMFKAQSVPLAGSTSKDGLYNNASGAAASFRSLSASAGSESDDWLSWWAGAIGATLPPSLSRSSDTATKSAGDQDIRRLVGGGGGFGHRQASVVFDSEDHDKWHRWSPFATAPRASAKRPAEEGSLPPQQSIKRASVESAGTRRGSQVLAEGGCPEPALQRSSTWGCGIDGPQPAAGLQTVKSCDDYTLAAASWHVGLDPRASRGSNASSPSRFTPPSASADEEPLPLAECRTLSLPLSVRKPLFSKLPDIDEEAHSRAFQEQAPEPLYLAAQLVMDMGADLPEFSYGRRSCGSDPICVHDAEGSFARQSDPGRLQ